MVPIQKVCLEPLSRDFKDRLAARGPTAMKWTCENLSARVVSHRAAPLGDGHPNTAYRQVVFRLSSDQRLLVSGTGWASLSSSSTVSTAGKPRWVPGEAKVKPDTEKNVVHQRTPFVDNGSSAKLTKVVEYLVLQIRIVNGIEEDWKVWGFTEESTPATIVEDEAYWRKQLSTQAAAVA
jgi:protein MBA1